MKASETTRKLVVAAGMILRTAFYIIAVVELFLLAAKYDYVRSTPFAQLTLKSVGGYVGPILGLLALVVRFFRGLDHEDHDSPYEHWQFWAAGGVIYIAVLVAAFAFFLSSWW